MADKITILKYAAGACLLVSFATALGGFFGSAEMDTIFNSKLCPSDSNVTAGAPHCQFKNVGIFLELTFIMGLIFCVIFLGIIIKRDLKGNSCTTSNQATLFLVGAIWLIIGGILMFVSTMLPVIKYLSLGGQDFQYSNSPLTSYKLAFKQAEKMTAAFSGLITAALFLILWCQVKGGVPVDREEKDVPPPKQSLVGAPKKQSKPSIKPPPKPSLQTAPKPSLQGAPKPSLQTAPKPSLQTGPKPPPPATPADESAVVAKPPVRRVPRPKPVTPASSATSASATSESEAPSSDTPTPARPRRPFRPRQPPAPKKEEEPT